MDTFGEWLRQQRNHSGLTRGQFADRVGCSIALLRKIEDGERRPSSQIAELMANCLNIPPEERATFVKVARGELSVERLSPPSKPVIPSPPPHNILPVFPTPLVGRQAEMDRLSQLMRDPQCCLLALVGPGGIGKTRLAVEVASTLQDFFADGVYFVPLAPVNNTRFIVPVIADTIGFAFESTRRADPKTQLFRYLKEKQALFLMDNLEQLLAEPGIEVLGEILENTRDVKLLATSRETVGLQGEWVFEVQGLPVPENGPAEETMRNTSVELFLQRARRAHVGFNATVEDYPAIVRICQLVGGNPLGIELAAAWVRTLSCEEIAKEIERGLDFLSVSTRDLAPRHQSLRAVFDQSWKLLNQEEQGVLLRLSVFRGGFAREATEVIADASLAVLSNLVMKSFIRRGGAGRYDLHELIRQFAADHFAEYPEECAETQERHARYYLEYFSQAEARFCSPAQPRTLAELTAEIDNFRDAWDWCVNHNEYSRLEQTLRLLWLLYDTHGWFQDGSDMLGSAIDALEMAHGQSPPDRTNQVVLGHLLAGRSWFAYRLANYELAQRMLERSLEILRPLNEPHVLVEAINFLGELMEITGNYARALELYTEGEQVAAASGDKWYQAVFLTLMNGPAAISYGNIKPDHAYQGLQDAVANWRRIGDPRFTAFALRILSQSALNQALYDEAHAALEESAALNSTVGDRWGLGAAYRGLGIIAQVQGKHRQAEAKFRQSLDTFSELGGSWWVARVLAEMSRSLFALENDAEAKRVLFKSLRIANEIHATPVALAALAEFANLQAKQGDVEQAFETLWIVINHPASLQETKDNSARLRSDLEAKLTPRQMEAALTRAQTKAFEVIVDELLEQA